MELLNRAYPTAHIYSSFPALMRDTIYGTERLDPKISDTVDVLLFTIAENGEPSANSSAESENSA